MRDRDPLIGLIGRGRETEVYEARDGQRRVPMRRLRALLQADPKRCRAFLDLSLALWISSELGPPLPPDVARWIAGEVRTAIAHARVAGLAPARLGPAWSEQLGLGSAADQRSSLAPDLLNGLEHRYLGLRSKLARETERLLREVEAAR